MQVIDEEGDVISTDFGKGGRDVRIARNGKVARCKTHAGKRGISQGMG
jgi:hypothetical protein